MIDTHQSKSNEKSKRTSSTKLFMQSYSTRTLVIAGVGAAVVTSVGAIYFWKKSEASASSHSPTTFEKKAVLKPALGKLGDVISASVQRVTDSRLAKTATAHMEEIVQKLPTKDVFSDKMTTIAKTSLEAVYESVRVVAKTAIAATTLLLHSSFNKLSENVHDVIFEKANLSTYVEQAQERVMKSVQPIIQKYQHQLIQQVEEIQAEAVEKYEAMEHVVEEKMNETLADFEVSFPVQDEESACEDIDDSVDERALHEMDEHVEGEFNDENDV